MKVLLVHPSPLMYSEIFLRLEPIGVERVAAAVRAAGHEVRLLDLQIFGHADYYRELADFAPHAVGFSLNYLANVPEVLDLAKETKRRRPGCFVFAGGHSGSFIAEELLEHAEGALDAMVRGEGEAITPRLLEAAGDPRLATLPGVVTPDGAGPAPPRTSRASPSPTSSSWTTWPSSTPSTASRSAASWRSAACASSTTWRRAATCCCATTRSSSTGSGSACTTCSSASRRWTRRRSSCTASA